MERRRFFKKLGSVLSTIVFLGFARELDVNSKIEIDVAKIDAEFKRLVDERPDLVFGSLFVESI